MAFKKIQGDLQITGVLKDGEDHSFEFPTSGGTIATEEYVDSSSSVNAESITYAALVAKRNNAELIPGRFYRITDYTCTTVQENTSSAGHVFDIIVLATDPSHLDENAKATLHSGDTYFANSDLESWELKYSLDNDTNRFAWADSTNGKGVIYYMKDEFNNELAYDFKNILYSKARTIFVNTNMGKFDYFRYSSGDIEVESTPYYCYKLGGGPSQTYIYFPTATPTTDAQAYDNTGTILSKYYVLLVKTEGFNNYFTFTGLSTVSYTLVDASLNTATNICYNNKIERRTSTYNKYSLNSNVIYSSGSGLICYDNIILLSSSSNLIKSNFCENRISEGFTSNIIDTSFNNNSIGKRFNNNIIGTMFSYNVIGNNFIDNIIGTNFGYNTIVGNDFRSNNLQNYFRYNYIGNSFQQNTIGNYFSLNSIGNQFEKNLLGDGTTLADYIKYCHFEDGVQYIKFYSTDTVASNSNWLQNVHVSLGVMGASTQNPLVIEVPDRKLTYETEYYLDNLGNLQMSNFITKITYSDLVALRDSGNLVPGKQYRITDYQTTTVQENTSAAGHQFDIIVTADSANKLNEFARAIRSDGDTEFPDASSGVAYFANSKLEAWQLKYCLDNDTTKFDWADSTNGKGVIYWMKDEFDNELAYDFKNILYTQAADIDVNTTYGSYVYFYYPSGNVDINGTTYYCYRSKNGPGQTYIYFPTTTPAANDPAYNSSGVAISDYSFKNFRSPGFTNFYTFTYKGNTTPADSSLFYQCSRNKIGVYTNGSSKFKLNNTVFATGGNPKLNCISNILGEDNKDNYFSGTISNNTIGNRCQDNYLINLSRNTIGSDFRANSVLPNTTSLPTTVGMSYNNIGHYFTGNRFSSRVIFQNNFLGNSSSGNTFNVNGKFDSNVGNLSNVNINSIMLNCHFNYISLKSSLAFTEDVSYFEYGRYDKGTTGGGSYRKHYDTDCQEILEIWDSTTNTWITPYNVLTTS